LRQILLVRRLDHCNLTEPDAGGGGSGADAAAGGSGRARGVRFTGIHCTYK